MKYYEINEKIARLAHEMMSMRSYEEGSATTRYRAAVDEAAALVEQKKKEISPFYYDKLDALLDRYARRLAEWTNAHNRNGASCPSVLVCGWANFPTKKKDRQNAREESLWKEYDEIEGILSKIKSMGTGPIDLMEPHARELLEERLKSLQNRLETGKAMNVHYRKHKTMQGFPDISDETAAEMDKAIASAPSFARTPFPDFELTSIRGKIKRTQENLAKLDKIDAAQDKPNMEESFDGGRVIHNVAENRLQIIFDEIPNEKIRTALKSHGFRWSRKNQAWQRQLTQNAMYDARHILNISASTKPATADEGDIAQQTTPLAAPDEEPPIDIPLAADGQALFLFEAATQPKYLESDHAAKTKKALDALARFQASRFTVYGRSPGHKNFHPTAPSRGQYNCGLMYQERYQDQETAQRVADFLARENPGWTFQVRKI